MFIKNKYKSFKRYVDVNVDIAGLVCNPVKYMLKMCCKGKQSCRIVLPYAHI